MNGKRVIEDRGMHFGRTKHWAAIPEDLYVGSPPCSSTTIVCEKCGSPWGGLTYDTATDTFRHREACRRQR